MVMEFFAEWCQPCNLMTPILQQVKARVGERATILSVDIEKEPSLAQQYKVQAVPTLIVFHQGQVLWRKNGISPAHEILEHLQTMID